MTVSLNPIDAALSDAATPPPGPQEIGNEPAVLPDGMPMPADEAIQVAGPVSAIKGLFKGAKKAEAVAEGVAKEAPAAGATPPAPASASAATPAPGGAATPPASPPPKRKTTAQIKQGVIERAAPTVTEAEAIKRAQQMTEPVPAPAEPGRTAVRNFRSDKLQSPESVLRLIDEVAADNAGAIEAQRRGVRSWDETKAAAAEGPGIEDLLGTKPGTAFNAEQLEGGRQVLLELGARIDRAAPHILSGAATAEDKLAFRQMLAQHAGVQQVLQGAVAEAGRALNIMRSVTAAGGRIRSQQVVEALDTLGGDAATRRLAEMVLDAGGDVGALSKVTRKSWGARSVDILNEIYINGLLSGPTTHVVNTVSNSITSLMQIPERATAAAIGKLLPGSEHVEMGEAAQQVYGLLAGWRDAFSAFGRVMKTGEPVDPMAKLENANRKAVTSANLGLDPESTTGKAIDLFGEYYVRIPGRVLMAEDEFFKTIGYRMELHAQALRQASAEGLTGQARDARIASLVAEPSAEMHQAAEKMARYTTFQDALAGENFIQQLGQAGQKLADMPLGRLVLPFIRTPTNIAQYTLERTPLAPILGTWRADVAAGGARRDLALARLSLGSALAAVVATYAASGRITGSGPSDPRLAAEMRAAGWQPYSVLIDGKYVSYNRMDPVGAMIGSAADAVDVLRYAEDEETRGAVAGAVVFGFFNAMVNKTYMQSLGGVIDGLRQADEGKLQAVQNVAAKQVAAFVPSWLNFIRQSTDEVVREPVKGDPLSQTLDMMKNRIPGLSKDLPPRLDLFGNEVRPESAPLSPAKASTGKDDPVLAELIANRIAVGRPDKAVSVPLGVNLSATVDLTTVDPTGWLLHNYRKAAGRIAYREMEKLAGAKDWPNLSRDEKEEEAKRVFMDARREALAEVMAEHPEIETTAMQELERGDTKGTMPLPGHMR